MWVTICPPLTVTYLSLLCPIKKNNSCKIQDTAQHSFHTDLLIISTWVSHCHSSGKLLIYIIPILFPLLCMEVYMCKIVYILNNLRQKNDIMSNTMIFTQPESTNKQVFVTVEQQGHILHRSDIQSGLLSTSPASVWYRKVENCA